MKGVPYDANRTAENLLPSGAFTVIPCPSSISTRIVPLAGMVTPAGMVVVVVLVVVVVVVLDGPSVTAAVASTRYEFPYHLLGSPQHTPALIR